MKLFSRKVFLLPVALAGTFAFAMPQAGAQSLFEHLFGGVRSPRLESSGHSQRGGRLDDSRQDNEDG